MGEFAIGTNTTAYEVALRYGILDKFPILIAEKMGPHFAVGDTCYSWMEDCPVFNRMDARWWRVRMRFQQNAKKTRRRHILAAIRTLQSRTPSWIRSRRFIQMERV